METYNQLLKDKKAVDKDNSRLRQEKDEQKESVLKIKGAFTYIEGQVAKLQAKQRHEPTPQPPLNNQIMLPPTILLQVTSPPATPLESTSVGESKKIVVILNPPIFNRDGKEILHDHWLLQMRNKMTANEKIIPIEIFKKVYM